MAYPTPNSRGWEVKGEEVRLFGVCFIMIDFLPVSLQGRKAREHLGPVKNVTNPIIRATPPLPNPLLKTPF